MCVWRMTEGTNKTDAKKSSCVERANSFYSSMQMRVCEEGKGVLECVFGVMMLFSAHPCSSFPLV